MFDPDTFGPFTCCVSQEMHHPEKMHIDSLFIIHGNMSKILCHVVYSMFNKHTDNLYSVLDKHGRITRADIEKTLQYDINILKHATNHDCLFKKITIICQFKLFTGCL